MRPVPILSATVASKLCIAAVITGSTGNSIGTAPSGSLPLEQNNSIPGELMVHKNQTAKNSLDQSAPDVIVAPDEKGQLHATPQIKILTLVGNNSPCFTSDSRECLIFGYYCNPYRDMCCSGLRCVHVSNVVARCQNY